MTDEPVQPEASPTHYVGKRLLAWRLRPFTLRLEIGRLQWLFSTEGYTVTWAFIWHKSQAFGVAFDKKRPATDDFPEERP